MWGKLYKRALFNNVRFPLGKLHEDEFVTYKILFNCDDVAYIDQPLYYYYQNPEGIMLSKWNPRRMDAFEAFEEQSEFFKNLPSVYEAQGRRYMRNLMNTLEVIKDDSEYKQYQKIIHKKD